MVKNIIHPERVKLQIFLDDIILSHFVRLFSFVQVYHGIEIVSIQNLLQNEEGKNAKLGEVKLKYNRE
jgi:hypothetical protein